MRQFSATGICQSKRGLLFLRDCGDPVVDQCSLCGRPLCAAHLIVTQEGPVCPECQAQEENRRDNVDETSTDQSDIDDDEDDTESGQIDATSYATRTDYYERFDYRPIMEGSSQYFSDPDYRTFDRAKPQTGAEISGEADAGSIADEPVESEDSDDLDHFMES